MRQVEWRLMVVKFPEFQVLTDPPETPTCVALYSLEMHKKLCYDKDRTQRIKKRNKTSGIYYCKIHTEEIKSRTTTNNSFILQTNSMKIRIRQRNSAKGLAGTKLYKIWDPDKLSLKYYDLQDSLKVFSELTPPKSYKFYFI